MYRFQRVKRARLPRRSPLPTTKAPVRRRSLRKSFFRAIDNGDHFIGGKLNAHPHVFVHGIIRSGRALEVKRKLMGEAADKVGKIAGVGVEDVWFYIQDMDAPQMIEFGRFLPEPGAEAEWRNAITRRNPRSSGRRASRSDDTRLVELDARGLDDLRPFRCLGGDIVRHSCGVLCSGSMPAAISFCRMSGSLTAFT